MMALTNDALQHLQQAIKNHDPITYSTAEGPCPSFLDATHIVISSSVVLPKSTPTRWRKPGVAAALEPSDFFSLEAIYLAWLLRDAPGADYLKQARENGLTVGFVSVTERKSVVDWLEGKTTDHERIVPLTCAYGGD